MIPLLLPAALVGGSTLLSSMIQSSSARRAASAQASAAAAGVEEQRRQFNRLQELLAPFVQAGSSSLQGQQALLGLLGQDKQREAIASIESSPEMTFLAKQGETGILQNASATGGLRGGNVQGALMQFRPQLLSNLINQQYERLGGITQLGQASAAGVGSAGMQSGVDIANLLQSAAAARAGGILAGGQGALAIPNALMAGLGTYAGLGGKF